MPEQKALVSIDNHNSIQFTKNSQPDMSNGTSYPTDANIVVLHVESHLENQETSSNPERNSQELFDLTEASFEMGYSELDILEAVIKETSSINKLEVKPRIVENILVISAKNLFMIINYIYNHEVGLANLETLC